MQREKLAQPSKVPKGSKKIRPVPQLPPTPVKRGRGRPRKYPLDPKGKYTNMIVPKIKPKMSKPSISSSSKGLARSITWEDIVSESADDFSGSSEEVALSANDSERDKDDQDVLFKVPAHQRQSIGSQPWDPIMNPLPGFVDSITYTEVVRPAISPFGHVLSYATWLRCLCSTGETKNRCPLTKQPLSKRQLTLLTFDNIDRYRHLIKRECL